MYLDTNLMD